MRYSLEDVNAIYLNSEMLRRHHQHSLQQLAHRVTHIALKVIFEINTKINDKNGSHRALIRDYTTKSTEHRSEDHTTKITKIIEH